MLGAIERAQHPFEHGHDVGVGPGARPRGTGAMTAVVAWLSPRSQISQRISMCRSALVTRTLKRALYLPLSCALQASSWRLEFRGRGRHLAGEAAADIGRGALVAHAQRLRPGQQPRQFRRCDSPIGTMTAVGM